MKTLTTLVLSALLTVGCSMTGQVQAEDDYFSQAELDSMLAPVALYPDSVLSHVLIAATYPLEVIQAARWSREHPGLRGEDAVAAVEYRNWDPSVKALVAFPELLGRMDEDLDWTQNLGDAFLMQEEEVVASIQYLRSEAYSKGHLASNDRVKVVREKEYIYIEPARTRVVYVPYYDPRVIYSSWRWSSHPPRYWHRPSGFSVSMNFHWGRPYHVRPNFYFSSFHWAQRRVVVVNHHHHYYRDHGFRSGRDVARFKQARHWKHDPTHRRGVSYRGQVQKARFVDSKRPVSARQNASATRSAVRSDRREWAAERRSSTTFDRKAQSRTSAASRSERAAESRVSDRGQSRIASSERGNSNSRIASRSSARTESSRSSERSRSVTGRAPERAATRSGSTTSARSSADRSSRVSESLRSGSRSRAAETSRSRGVERSSEGARTSNSRASGRSSAGFDSRSDSKRSSVSIPRDLSVRSSNARERSSSPSSSSRSSAPSRGASIGRSSAPSRESTTSRSRSSSRSSAQSRSTPSVRSSAPSRSSNASAPSRGSRSSAPSRSSKSSTPSRSSATSTRSSRGSAQSRSRGGDSRRGGRGDGEERR
ncbi:DUF3300 domain-containing protein [Wenzhouxiangella sp. EGI_FJ10305]|uniref:DUF3300 domain-containing protein n=1 Tax=Wenzhouxiangella sp. EGI_FJ10305 TaxID=3243768 RepID=UPI0035E035FE